MTLLKYITLVFLSLVLITPINASSTGIFSTYANFNPSYTTGGLSTSGSAHGMDSIVLKDPETLQNLQFVSAYFDGTGWAGGTDSSYYATVSIRKNSPVGDIIGQGLYGYWHACPTCGYYITLNLQVPDAYLDLSGLSGETHLYFTGAAYDATKIQLTQRSNVALATPGDTVFTWSDDVGSPYESFITAEYTTYYAIDFVNTYTYSMSDVAKSFFLDRNSGNLSKIIVTDNASNEIINESAMAWATQDEDLYVFYGDVVNNTWTLELEIASGYTFPNRTITFYPPTLTSTVSWNADTYLEKTLGNFSYEIADTVWDDHTYYSLKTNVYHDPYGAKTLTYSHTIGSLQEAVVYANLQNSGVYSVELVGYSSGSDLIGTVLDTDYVTVIPLGSNFISVNESVIHPGEPFSISYLFVVAPTSYADGINAKWLNKNNEWKIEKFWSFQSMGTTGINTIYTKNDTKISQEGYYIFELYSYKYGVLAQTSSIESILTTYKPSLNISTSNISTDRTAYNMGSILSGNYRVDNTNYSDYRLYLQFYNFDFDEDTMSIPLSKQTDSFSGYLSSSDESDTYVYGNIISAIPGNMAVRLYGENSTGSLIIASTNFTVSAITSTGFGLTLSKYTACVNDVININAIAPSSAIVRVYNPNGAPIKSFPINASTTLQYMFLSPGLYEVSIFPYNTPTLGEISTSININSCAGETYIPPEQQGENIYSNFLDFMMLPIFWGMIIWIGVSGGMMQVGASHGAMKSAGIISFLFLQILAVVGLFAPFTIYIMVVSWIIMGMFFYVGRQMGNME